MNTALAITQPGAYRANIRRWQVMISKCASTLGLPRDEVEQFARDQIAVITGGDRSTKALDARGWAMQYVWLQDRIDRAQGATSAQPRPDSRAGRANRQALSTAAQRKVIDTLRELLGWTIQEQEIFCTCHLKFTKPSTRWRASNLIDALKPQVLRMHQVRERIDRALDLPIDQADRILLLDVARQYDDGGKQGSSVEVGAIPIVLKVLSRYGIEKKQVDNHDHD